MHPMMLELLPWVRQGYCCSQLLLLLMLRIMDQESAPVVRAAQGLCHGIGQSDGPCGLLTGRARKGRKLTPCLCPCYTTMPHGLRSALRRTAASVAGRWPPVWGLRPMACPIPQPAEICWPNAGKKLWSLLRPMMWI